MLFLVTENWWKAPEETFIWAVSRTQARWVRTPLGEMGIKQHVDALR